MGAPRWGQSPRLRARGRRGSRGCATALPAALRTFARGVWRMRRAPRDQGTKAAVPPGRVRAQASGLRTPGHSQAGRGPEPWAPPWQEGVHGGPASRVEGWDVGCWAGPPCQLGAPSWCSVSTQGVAAMGAGWGGSVWSGGDPPAPQRFVSASFAECPGFPAGFVKRRTMRPGSQEAAVTAENLYSVDALDLLPCQRLEINVY